MMILLIAQYVFSEKNDAIDLSMLKQLSIFMPILRKEPSISL